VIRLRELPLNVAEACSGIRMLMLFFAICVGGSFLMTKRAWWERLLVVLTAIPIAIIANVFRLSLTAIFAELISKWPNTLLSVEMAKQWPTNFTQTWGHDLPGLLMMPMGLILLWIEWTLLSKLIVNEPEGHAVSLRGTARGLLPMAPMPRQNKQP
jgi:exosortase/archaeosortase family protein